MWPFSGHGTKDLIMYSLTKKQQYSNVVAGKNKNSLIKIDQWLIN